MNINSNLFKNLSLRIFLYILYSLIIISCDKNKNPISYTDDELNSYLTSDYVLPYPAGEEYTCILGNSDGVHTDHYKYCQDFAMPVGSIVTAVRDGFVIDQYEQVSDNDQSFENFLIIQHYDGSCAFYTHLKNSGILVENNQQIAQGDTIALSGNTGPTNNTPRLGFFVRQSGPYEQSPIVQIKFRNTITQPEGIKTGTSYPALAYESNNTTCEISNYDLPVSTPEQQNIDGNKLEQLVTEIQQNSYGEVHSLLISRNDTLVFEEYFNGFCRDDLHILYSATKSFTSALVGIAIDEGKINSVDDKLLSYFSAYPYIANRDSIKESITIKHLLTMTSGLSIELMELAYMRNDWVQAMLDLPMEFSPGTEFSYHTGNSLLLGAIIKEVTGIYADQYAAQKLFEPLGIQTWNWVSGPNNAIAAGGWCGGLSIRPLDMLKFGLLFLHKGKYNGETIVSEAWVQESTARHTPFTPNANYSYQWCRIDENDSIAAMVKENDIFFAWGLHHQKIYIIPHLNVVIAFTSWDGQCEQMLSDYILPAVQ